MVLGGLFLLNIKLTSTSLNRTIEENGFSKVKKGINMRALSFWTSTSNCRLAILLVLAGVFLCNTIAPVSHSAAYGQDREDAISKTRRPSRAWRNNGIAARMKKLTSSMGLVTVGGFLS